MSRNGFLRGILTPIFFPFYAGLTHLTNKKALTLFSKSLEHVIDNQSILAKHRSSQGRSDPQQEALTFLKCLFECQKESVWKLSETELHPNVTINQKSTRIHKAATFPSAPETSMAKPIHVLSLNNMAMTPLDCLSLVYYIHAKSFMPASKTNAFNLHSCAIDNTGLRLLFTELKRGIDYCTQVRVQLILNHTKLNKDSALSLKELLRGQSNFEALGLCNCFDPSVVDLNFVFKSLIEGLSNDSSCNFIDLSHNGFDSSHIYYVILMLRSCLQIRWLEFRFFDLSKVMPLFFNILPLTKLQCLDLSYCHISDVELLQLGTCICFCTSSIVQLIIRDNPFTDNGITNFLKLFLNNRFSRLTYLGIDEHQHNKHQQNIILKQINLFRSHIRYPSLHLNSYVDDIDFPNEFLNNLLVQQFRKYKDGR